MDYIEQVYDTLTGNLLPEYRVPGVPDLFAAGMPCEENYTQVLEAYGRLVKRLGEAWEDDDVEIIINALLDNQKLLAMEMFRLGAKLQNECRAGS